jgi:hypothetical protein
MSEKALDKLESKAIFLEILGSVCLEDLIEQKVQQKDVMITIE